MFDPDSKLIEVKNNKTKEYLQEVISCYYNKNYRACVVTLYTTVLFDMYSKIVNCSEVYGDVTASKKIEEIAKLQKGDEKYSVIEAQVFKAFEKMGYLNNIEKDQYEQLKKARNNAAHPVYKFDYELVNPTKEQCLAHIRNMYEAIFMKDIIVSEKILDGFLGDICSFYHRQPELDGFKEYLVNKYYKRFNVETKKNIFTKIWGFAIHFNDEDTLKNRKVILKTINLFLEWDKDLFKKLISDNKAFYSKIKFEQIVEIRSEKDLFNLGSTTLIRVFDENPFLWEDVPQEVRVEFNNMIKENTYIAMSLDCIHESEEKYLESVVSCVVNQPNKRPCLDTKLLLEKYEKHKNVIGEKMRVRISDYYNRNNDSSTYVYDYDYININYNTFMKHILDDFGKEELVYLLSKLKARNYKQADTHSRFSRQVKELIEKKGYDIEISDYFVLG